jgi:Sec-independent protein translocase protein TatA
LTNNGRQLEQTMKEYKGVMKSQQKKIQQQLEMELENEKEKTQLK